MSIRSIGSKAFNTAEERYKALLAANPHVLKRIPLRLVAFYLGITPVSLSRIRGLR